MFTAVTDYTPSDEDTADHLPLKEGQQVQILDDANPDLWLCRLLDSPDKKVSECPKNVQWKVEYSIIRRTCMSEQPLYTGLYVIFM